MRSICSRLVTGLGVVTVLTALLCATPAMAGIGGSDVPTVPPTAAVGDLINVSLEVINTSTAPNDTENVQLTSLFLTPSCADSSSPTCLPGNEDPGVFKVVTAVGDPGTAPCANIPFTISAPTLSGEVQLVPQSQVTLAPATAPEAARSCTVNLQLRVFKVPANPAPGPAVTTDPLTRVLLLGVNSGLTGGGSGSANIQILKGEVTLSSTANPNTTVPPGTSVTDTAVVGKAGGAIAPTGFVRFILCQPGQVNANGCPGGSGSPVPPDKPIVGNSVTSDPTDNTNDFGKYCWRVRYLGDDNYNASNHTNADTECFTVAGEPNLVLVKTPDNATYVLGDTISFTIVVSNNGNATAHNVRFSPPDALPDPTVSLNWGPANPTVTCNGQSGPVPICTVSGAIGSQVLNCNFGDIAQGGQCSVTVSSETTSAGACVPSLVNQATVVDDEGDSASDAGSLSCNPAGCRITGGPNGGQVGAPCGCIGNYLEFDHIQGNWSYRTGGGKFNASNFNSLTCGCDVADDGNTAALSNGQVCGDRQTGPTPPPAPSNVACFSGTGRLGNGAHAPLVAFRFEIRDHGEPGVLDENHIQIWIPTGQETAESIAQQIACTDSCSVFRPADIDEGLGVVATGNIQIHRDIAPHEGICPVPGEVCPVPPDGICPFDPGD